MTVEKQAVKEIFGKSESTTKLIRLEVEGLQPEEMPVTNARHGGNLCGP